MYELERGGEKGDFSLPSIHRFLPKEIKFLFLCSLSLSLSVDRMTRLAFTYMCMYMYTYLYEGMKGTSRLDMNDESPLLFGELEA